MSKYKLIKRYPSLPKDWKKGTIVKFINPSLYRPLNPEIHTDIGVFSEQVENSPEFWEKVVEKDYEILKIKGNYTGSVHIYNKMKNIGNDSHDFSIYQIKRLSDGEVFTVGDKLYLGEKRSNEILAEIKIIDDKLRFKAQFQVDLNHSWSSSYTLDFIQHAKKPLFTTEDGIDIYEGDDYWIVYSDFSIGCFHNSTKKPVWNNTYFSTKEKAREWIEENKPKYSKKEIKDALKNSIFHIVSGHQVIDVIRVKEKLNL